MANLKGERQEREDKKSEERENAQKQ